MKRILIALGLGLMLFTGAARAAELPELRVDGVLCDAVSHVENGTTYVSLRTAAWALARDVQISWEEGRAVARGEGLELSAVPGESWLSVNGRFLYIPGSVQAVNGRTLIPIRVLADAFGAQVFWSSENNTIHITTGGGPPTAQYQEDEVYWLSRIISSESRGESLAGQIAVGNVVLNRVASDAFPNTIYGVIFDDRWGGQFEPVDNGSIYDLPAEQSVLAAKLCLEGASVVGESLYFLDPEKAGNLWTAQNRPYVTTIGVHNFYA